MVETSKRSPTVRRAIAPGGEESGLGEGLWDAGSAGSCALSKELLARASTGPSVNARKARADVKIKHEDSCSWSSALTGPLLSSLSKFSVQSDGRLSWAGHQHAPDGRLGENAARLLLLRPASRLLPTGIVPELTSPVILSKIG